MKDNEHIYFISGGGTGGHIYPAFTVAQKLLKENTNNKIYYIGNPNNLEFEIVKRYTDITFLPVNITGMPRKISFSLIKWFFLLIFSFFKAKSYIKKYKPDAVFTTGGYVCAPIILAAIYTKIPYMIHDCDSSPGLVSKMAAPKAKIVSVAFENSKNSLKSQNIISNGNPVREEFFNIDKKQAREKLNIKEDSIVIFAMGGSQGARTINTAMINCLKELSKDNKNFIIIQTGKNKYKETVEELEKIFPEYNTKSNIMIKPYFDDMVYPLKSCDIVIARAGSVSLSEIIQCNIPSILIPYPYAAQDHQRKNAKEMVERGISLYLEDNDCSAENLLEKINYLLADKNRLLSMQEKTKEYTKSNPTEEIIKQLKSIIR